MALAAIAAAYKAKTSALVRLGHPTSVNERRESNTRARVCIAKPPGRAARLEPSGRIFGGRGQVGERMWMTRLAIRSLVFAA